MNTMLLFIYVFSLKIFMLGPFMVEGVSMEPNFHPGELFLINENVAHAQDFKRGDVIVFSLPDNAEYYYIKRIIGLPGEKIRVKKEGVYVDNGNGFVLLNETYLPEGSSVPATGAYREGYAQTYSVPEGKFFVLGDNRAHSLDSRYFESPFIGLEAIKGKFLINLYAEEIF